MKSFLVSFYRHLAIFSGHISQKPKFLFSALRIPQRKLSARIQQHLPNVLLRKEIPEPASVVPASKANSQRATAASPTLHWTSSESFSDCNVPRAEERRRCRRNVDDIVDELHHMQELQLVQRRWRHFSQNDRPRGRSISGIVSQMWQEHSVRPIFDRLDKRANKIDRKPKTWQNLFFQIVSLSFVKGMLFVENKIIVSFNEMN